MTTIDDLLPGESSEIKQLRSEVEFAAKTTAPVLLLGEAGTGKSAVARLIHELSPRKGGPFVVIDMVTLTPALVQSELFGHAKGAFTGAVSNRQGYLAEADGGTAFFDEIGFLNFDSQALLLSVLDTDSFHPVGSSSRIKVDVRYVLATSTDLVSEREAGRFRADLLQRLAGLTLVMPPLRKRKSDIPVLTSRLLDRIAERENKKEHFRLTPAAEAALQDYDFPGNLRDLQNILQMAAANADGGLIDAPLLRFGKAPTARRESAMREVDEARREIDALTREMASLRSRSILAEPIWQGRGFAVQHDYCFVLMPFGDMRELQAVYRDHVKPVIERLGLTCERADDIYDVSGIMQSVWECINRARVVVADLTDRNANVFYELGIAHTLGKPVIMIAQSIDFVPFDLRHLRCITYSYTPKGVLQLEATLERTLKTVLASAADLRVS